MVILKGRQRRRISTSLASTSAVRWPPKLNSSDRRSSRLLLRTWCTRTGSSVCSSSRTSAAEAAADYGAGRERERIARNPALKGQPDKEMEYVAKWVTFLRARGLADIPLMEMCTKVAPALATYFDEKHIQKGNKLSTMHREDTYHTVMNHAASKGWAPERYPRAQLPDYDILEQPVNKWLYPEEIMLFIRLAPKHLPLFTAGVFATGIRGGELLFVSRRRPSCQPNTTGLSLEPGQEHILSRLHQGRARLCFPATAS